MFSFNQPKPSLSLGTSTANNNNTGLGSSFFNTNASTAAKPAFSFGPAPSTNTNQQQQQSQQQQQQQQQTPQSATASSSTPQIDVAHLRSTTKYDHLTPALQQEILGLDTAILNQIRQSNEVSDLLPTVKQASESIAPAVDFIDGKLEELETGLENDAEGIVGLRDGDVKKDEGEAKCVFRAVDRLKVPRQYQVGVHTADAAGSNGTGVFGGMGNGYTGWWNQPQTLRGSVRAATGAQGQSMLQLVDVEGDDESGLGSGPKNLVELFNGRTKEMEVYGERNRELLREIEEFVLGLEGKVVVKERELNEKIERGAGDGDRNAVQEEREHRMQLLRFVFGEVQKNLYEVAEKIGTTRDGVLELGMRR